MLFYVVALLGILLDQVSKYWAHALQAMPGGSYALWPGVLHLTWATNTGAAFSLLEGGRVFFIILTLLAVGVIVAYVVRRGKKLDWMERVSLGLITAGAVGNLIDRVRLGYVVDFFEVRFIRFAIFNVADCCVVVGTIAFCAIMLFHPKHNKKVVPTPPVAEESDGKA